VYKTKSVEERLMLLNLLSQKFPHDDFDSLYVNIETESDWLRWPFMCYDNAYEIFNLMSNRGLSDDDVKVENMDEFMAICGVSGGDINMVRMYITPFKMV